MRPMKSWTLLLAALLILPWSREISGGSAPCESVVGVNISNGGTGYAAGDVGGLVTFFGDGGGATARIFSVSGGAVTAVQMTNLGAGYTTANVAISAPIGGGVTATGTAVITPPCPCGTVAGVIITNGGSGYVSGDFGRPVTFSGGGAGSGAVGIIGGVAGGAVTAVLMTVNGTGYFPPPAASISAPLGGGTTATGTAVLGPCSVPTLPPMPLVLLLATLFFVTTAVLWRPGKMMLARANKARRSGASTP